MLSVLCKAIHLFGWLFLYPFMYKFCRFLYIYTRSCINNLKTHTHVINGIADIVIIGTLQHHCGCVALMTPYCIMKCKISKIYRHIKFS